MRGLIGPGVTLEARFNDSGARCGLLACSMLVDGVPVLAVASQAGSQYVVTHAMSLPPGVHTVYASEDENTAYNGGVFAGNLASLFNLNADEVLVGTKVAGTADVCTATLTASCLSSGINAAPALTLC